MSLVARLSLLTFFLSIRVQALTSYHMANPIAWMYDLPVGETPGWEAPVWFNLEINQANIWNHSFSMTDTRTGDVYTFEADYEQSSAIAEMGFALTPTFAASVEVPYANHNGGFLDTFIDQFHQTINCDRFLRDLSGFYGNHLVIQKNGVDLLSSQHAEGVGNAKLKLKWWPLQWNSPTPGVCDCGFAVSAQIKFPMQTYAHGLTSGHMDYSALVHLGIPIGQFSGIWATSAVTKLGDNPIFTGWPTRKWMQMYELSLNLGLGPSWGVLAQMRYESPLFEKAFLNYNYTYTDTSGQNAERLASGWNGMMYWRGSEAIGLRYLWGGGSQVNFLFVEDWALGKYDNDGQSIYSNDAPDVEFLSQLHFVF